MSSKSARGVKRSTKSKKSSRASAGRGSLREAWEGDEQDSDEEEEAKRYPPPGRSFVELLAEHSWDAAFLLINRKSANESDLLDGDKTMLHQAARADAPIALIAKIIKLNPASASSVDKLGKLPLHYAAEHCSSPAVMESIFAAHTDATLEEDHAGHTPLHCALRHNVFPDMLDSLLHLDPRSLHLSDPHGNTTLHIAAEACLNASSVASVLRLDPSATAAKNAAGMLPLHCAAASGNAQAAKLVLFAAPECAEAACVDAHGRTALHHAAACLSPLGGAGPVALGSRAHRSIIAEAMRGGTHSDEDDDDEEEDEEGMVEDGESGHGINAGSILATVQLLIEANAACLRAVDAEGNTPLHAASSAQHASPLTAVSVARALIEAEAAMPPSAGGGPASIARPNALGRCPLHLAALQGCAALVRLLAGAFPSAVVMADAEGRRPLHVACASALCPLETRCALVDLDIGHANAAAAAAPHSAATTTTVAALPSRRDSEVPMLGAVSARGVFKSPVSAAPAAAAAAAKEEDEEEEDEDDLSEEDEEDDEEENDSEEEDDGEEEEDEDEEDEEEAEQPPPPRRFSLAASQPPQLKPPPCVHSVFRLSAEMQHSAPMSILPTSSALGAGAGAGAGRRRGSVMQLKRRGEKGAGGEVGGEDEADGGGEGGGDRWSEPPALKPPPVPRRSSLAV